MKKIAIITSAVLVMFSAAVNAQTDTVPKVPTEQVPAQTEQVPVQTEQVPVAAEKPVSTDKYNNWSSDTYKMQPMPEALTTEKIFPVIGKYQLTNKEGVASEVSVMLDPSNKGIIWIEGLPQGKIKGTLRKSPATYKIPAQPLGETAVATEDEVKDAKSAKNIKAAKELPEGVLIYDRDANVLNVCIGCKYNTEDPASTFLPTETAVTEEAEKTEKKMAKGKTVKKEKTKIVKVKPVHYTGSKIIETTASATEVQQ